MFSLFFFKYLCMDSWKILSSWPTSQLLFVFITRMRWNSPLNEECSREFIQRDMITKPFYIYVNYLLMIKARHMYVILEFYSFWKVLNTYKISEEKKIRNVYPFK